MEVGKGNIEKAGSETLELIGTGGFATVYRIQGTLRVIKKLRKEMEKEASSVHRFNREYDIMEGLQDIPGIVKVYNHNPSYYSYEMDYYDTTLDKCISEGEISEEERISLIINILDCMAEVHSRGVMHRDLSPTNILMKFGTPYIADFGIGRDTNVDHSHHTKHTHGTGQYLYTAPEQLLNLSQSSFQSDVYSLGRIINRIFTEEADNNGHLLGVITSKACARTPGYRYSNAGELRDEVKAVIEKRKKIGYQEKIISKINESNFDDDVKSYIMQLNATELATLVAEGNNGVSAVISLLGDTYETSLTLIDRLEQGIHRNSYSFANYDKFSEIMYQILAPVTDISSDFDIKVIAAQILNYVAYNIGRYDAQRKIDKLKNEGIEPTIEEIFD